MDIKFDQQIEVTPYQYIDCVNKLSGAIAHRHDEVNNKFYIKLWDMSSKYSLLKILSRK